MVKRSTRSKYEPGIIVNDPKRVLFLCIGNACRSQMAEAFARAYGRGVLAPSSAGLAPAQRVPDDTIRAMEEKNLDVRAQVPKSLSGLTGTDFDLVINMSGYPLPQATNAAVREWDVPDPIGMDYVNHCQIRDHIEMLVKDLIAELRRGQT
jgi:arsenate reductase (thioredoxin)